MRWFFLIIALLLVCDGLEIAYWRQTGAGDSLSGIAVFTDLFIIPFTIIASVFIIFRLIKWRKLKREKAQEQSAEIESSLPSLEDPSMPWLQVHQIAIRTYLEDSEVVIEQLRTLNLPEIDPKLSLRGKSIASRRIDLDIDETNTSSLRSERAQRLQVIMQHLFIAIDQTLSDTAKHMAFSQLMDTPLPNSHRQALLHPAWSGQTVAEQPKIVSELIQSSWSKLSLQIVCFLPAHLSTEDQAQIQFNITTQHLAQYEFNTDRVQIIYEVVHDADESLSKINQYTTGLADNLSPQLLLIFGMDSALDQKWLDEQTHRYTPAEAGFSILLSNETTKLPDLPILAHLTIPITTIRQKPISALGQINADDLIALLTALSHRYKIPETSLVLELGLLFTDTTATTQSAHSNELSKVLERLNINMNQTAYAGKILESTNSLTSGIAMVLAVQHVLESQQHTLVLCSGGETVRTVCLVTTSKADDEI